MTPTPTPARVLVAESSVPIGNRWSVDPRVGLALPTLNSSDGYGDRDTFKGASLVVGVGAAFSVRPQVRIHLDWEKYRHVDGPYGPRYISVNEKSYYGMVDVSAFALNVEYRW